MQHEQFMGVVNDSGTKLSMFDGLSINWQIFWRDMAQKKIGVVMKECACEYFREVICWIKRSVIVFEYDNFALHPGTQRKVLDVDVMYAWSRFLGFAH